LVHLFDGYRHFYRQASEPDRIRKFLLDRFEHNQSVIFVALKGGTAVGFTQLYPSFSSGGLARIFILNDLFVDAGARHIGAGSALLLAAAALRFSAVYGDNEFARPITLRKAGMEERPGVLHLSNYAVTDSIHKVDKRFGNSGFNDFRIRSLLTGNPYITNRQCTDGRQSTNKPETMPTVALSFGNAAFTRSILRQ
jgi:GNAT superfamily N-acetyltransferase